MRGEEMTTSEHAARLLVAAMRLKMTEAKVLAARKDETTLHQVADTFIPKFSVAFRYAFAMARKQVKRGKRSNADSIAKVVGLALNTVLPGMLVKAAAAGGQVALDAVALRALEIRTADGPTKIKFDTKNPHVIAWAAKHAAELITQITDTTRDRIRMAVELLQDTGDWDLAYDRIASAVGDEDRADLIARHETMLAADEGQRQGWAQAAEAGLLPPDARRVWITTPDERLCPVCEPLEGMTAPLDGEYPGGFEGPPAHVQCRCTEGIGG